VVGGPQRALADYVGSVDPNFWAEPFSSPVSRGATTYEGHRGLTISLRSMGLSFEFDNAATRGYIACCYGYMLIISI